MDHFLPNSATTPNIVRSFSGRQHIHATPDSGYFSPGVSGNSSELQFQFDEESLNSAETADILAAAAADEFVIVEAPRAGRCFDLFRLSNSDQSSDDDDGSDDDGFVPIGETPPAMTSTPILELAAGAIFQRRQEKRRHKSDSCLPLNGQNKQPPLPNRSCSEIVLVSAVAKGNDAKSAFSFAGQQCRDVATQTEIEIEGQPKPIAIVTPTKASTSADISAAGRCQAGPSGYRARAREITRQLNEQQTVTMTTVAAQHNIQAVAAALRRAGDALDLDLAFRNELPALRNPAFLVINAFGAIITNLFEVLL